MHCYLEYTYYDYFVSIQLVQLVIYYLLNIHNLICNNVRISTTGVYTITINITCDVLK